MPRGQNKRWMPSIPQGEIADPERYVDPWPRGATPLKKDQRKGIELSDTVRTRTTNIASAAIMGRPGWPLSRKGSQDA